MRGLAHDGIDMSHGVRLARYSEASTALALPSDRRPGQLVDGARSVGSGIGVTRAVLAVAGEWLFTSFINGTALPDLPPAVDDAGARYEAGAAIARVHRLTGDRYGYPGERAHGATWRQAFTAIIDELLADAVGWEVTLPAPADHVRDVVARQAPFLDAVERPALLHFDLWDGNLLATVDARGRTRLRGLVDGERYLYGDWLLDLVSPCIFRRAEDEPRHPFLRGYVAETGEPFVVDETVRRRLALYRLHLYLLLLVEMPSRALTGSYGQARRTRGESVVRGRTGRAGPRPGSVVTAPPRPRGQGAQDSVRRCGGEQRNSDGLTWDGGCHSRDACS